MSSDASESFKVLPINPDRFCEGISKIGYKPVAAIMDIVDNSVAAGATEIEIELEKRSGTTMSSAGNVLVFRIYDNGSGMTETGVETALEIGSDVQYGSNSLSKFGLGLKSAGFSLGRRIALNSQAVDGELMAKFVDRDIIRDRGQYGVCGTTPSSESIAWISAHGHGTVVEISKTPERQDSAAKIRRDLLKRLRVTYCEFLEREESPLKLTIKCDGEAELVTPLDILFWKDAADQFDEETYEGKFACKALDSSVGSDLLSIDEEVRLQITVFPMAKMKQYPGFTDAERQRVADYQVSQDNSGFFFYRNGRLIRWGDKIAQIGRDALGFRARVHFTTAHDDLFHVDVSKQNLELSEEFEGNLAKLCRTPLGTSKQIFDICKSMLNLGAGGEGAAFNERTEVFEENDPAEEVAPVPSDVKIERQRNLEAETRNREEDEQESPAGDEPSGVVPVIFQRIRYSDKVLGLDLAVPGTDFNEGTYVRINRLHTFYDTIIKHFDPSDPARVAIEAILWSSAVAETKACENISDISYEQLRSIFVHFRKVFSQTLDMWSLSNQDLFE